MRAAALATTLAIACIPKADYATGPRQNIELTLLIDPEFTSDEIVQVMYGAIDWTHAAEGVQFNIGVEPCRGQPMPPDVVCIVPDTSETMEETYHCVDAVGCTSYSRRLIMLDRWHLSPQRLRLVASHEIGHALHLPDVEQGVGIVMAKYVTNMVAPTCKDVAKLWLRRGVLPQRCLNGS